MSDRLPPLERVGDGFGDAALAAHVADAIAFIQYAIEDKTWKNNTSRMPSHDPDHWLAAPNCGVASMALTHYLGEVGYQAEVFSNYRVADEHALVETEVAEERVWIDPTALQFLSAYDIQIGDDTSQKKDDFFGQQLPAERILIFRPIEYQTVAQWMSAVVHTYWQTKTTGLYQAGRLSKPPRASTLIGAPYYRTKVDPVATISQAKMESDFARIYIPNEFELYDNWTREDYERLYKMWNSAKPYIDNV